MKKKIIKFDDFIVWIFQMKEDEVRVFEFKEITRNQPVPPFLHNGLSPEIRDKVLPNIVPCWSIQVVTKGKIFLTGLPEGAHYGEPGWGGAYMYMKSETCDLTKIKGRAVLDDSEFHCITPRKKDGKLEFWGRQITRYAKGTIIPFWDEYEQIVYVASGQLASIETNPIKIARNYSMIRMPAETMTQYRALEDSILVTLHRNP